MRCAHTHTHTNSYSHSQTDTRTLRVLTQTHTCMPGHTHKHENRHMLTHSLVYKRELDIGEFASLFWRRRAVINTKSCPPVHPSAVGWAGSQAICVLWPNTSFLAGRRPAVGQKDIHPGAASSLGSALRHGQMEDKSPQRGSLERQRGDFPSPGCEWKPTNTVTLVRQDLAERES